MANVLSGIIAGTKQGITNWVASKRHNRQVARDNRRYENELMFRIGSARAAKAERDRAFAYQQTRDKQRDEQWAAEHGLAVDSFAETKRTNLAHEEFRQDAHTEGIRQFNETLEERRQATLQANRRHQENLTQRKEEHLDAVEGQRLSRLLTQKRDTTLENYYNDQIRLKEAALNRPLTDIERRKLESEIAENEARARYYDRQPQSSKSRTTPQPTWMQAGELSATTGSDLAERFADRGAAFTWNPVGADLGGRLTKEKLLPFMESSPFYYDEASGAAPGQPTQVSEMKRFGAETFNRLWRETGDVNLAMQRMEQAYDAMLLDENWGGKVRNYMRHYGPENAEQELRQYFLQGGLEAVQQLRLPAPTQTGSPSEQIQLSPRY